MPRTKLNCCVTGCGNSASNKDLSFFSIPDDEDRCDEWLRLIGREDLTNKKKYLKTRRVCEEHFSPEVLHKYSRKIVKKIAVPTRRLPYAVEVRFTSKLTQTENEDSIYPDAKDSLQITCSDLDDHPDEKAKFYSLCDKFLTKELTQLLKMNWDLKIILKQNNKDHINFCLNLYQISPQAYQIFETVLGYPSVTTLLNKCVPMDTKLHLGILDSMKTRVNKMTAKEKNCSVIIGFTNIKVNLCYNINVDKIYGLQEINGIQCPESASRALVVMIRGLFSDWKLPFAYAILPKYGKAEDIANWIDYIIKSLFEIGLNVRTLVHNIEDDLINLNNEAVSNEKPYFSVGDKKIYYIYDPVDLIMSVRNSLLENYFLFQGQVAKHEHIVKFYNENQKKTIPIAVNLTNSHINPNKNEKKKVEYAVQLLSRTVANGLWTFINFNLIEKSGHGTVEFITTMNNLFDMLNVSKQNNGDNEYKKAFCATAMQTVYFEQIIEFFKRLKVFDLIKEKDVTSNARFIQGFLITMRSIILLFQDLKEEGHSYLLTRNLHAEALGTFINKLFKIQKSQKLTCLKFASAYKRMSLAYHKKFTLQGNYKDELEKFTEQSVELEEKIKQFSTSTDHCEEPMAMTSKISETNEQGNDQIMAADYKHIDTPEKHSLIYVSGYLLKKVEERHKNCLTLQSYMKSYRRNSKSSSNSTHLRYMEYIKRNPDSVLPAVPCNDFVNFVQKMDKGFVNAIGTNSVTFPISKSIYKSFDKSFAAPCVCFPTTYTMNLFIRIKIFYAVKLHNRKMRMQKHRIRNPFWVPKLS